MELRNVFGYKPDDIRVNQPDKSLVLPSCVIGIEVEVEGIPGVGGNERNYRGYWDVTTDNSLRDGGRELISKPIYGKDILMALDALEPLNEYRPSFSERTSVHVHLDVRDLKGEELCNLITIYTMVEPFLFSFVGKDRENSIYCIPYYKGEGSREIIGRIYNNIRINNSSRLASAVASLHKYTAMNLLPVASQGSVEFRHMYGTIDKELLLSWINIIFCIKKAAVDLSDKDWISSASVDGAKELLDLIFGEYSKCFINPSDKDFILSTRLAQDFITHADIVKGHSALKKCTYEKSSVARFSKRKKVQAAQSNKKTTKDYLVMPETVPLRTLGTATVSNAASDVRRQQELFRVEQQIRAIRAARSDSLVLTTDDTDTTNQ